MSSFDREDYLHLTQLAQQTERFEDMIEYVNEFLNFNQELNTSERSLVSSAYKNIVGNKRAELRVLNAIIAKEQKQENDTQIQQIQNYIKIIEDELRKLCQQILQQLDKKLIPVTKDLESKIFYLKMKGDYYRYMAEFSVDAQYKEAIQKGTDAYHECDQLARNNLPPTNPIRLGCHLNMSVFYYEILQNPQEAINICESAFNESISNIDNVNEESYKDCALIMQLLRDNLTLWQFENNEDEDEQN